jgi:hypothetical protein
MRPMRPEEYLYVCLIFSIIFAIHSAISFFARHPGALKLGVQPRVSSVPMLRVNLAKK